VIRNGAVQAGVKLSLLRLEVGVVGVAVFPHHDIALAGPAPMGGTMKHTIFVVFHDGIVRLLHAAHVVEPPAPLLGARDDAFAQVAVDAHLQANAARVLFCHAIGTHPIFVLSWNDMNPNARQMERPVARAVADEEWRIGVFRSLRLQALRRANNRLLLDFVFCLCMCMWY